MPRHPHIQIERLQVLEWSTSEQIKFCGIHTYPSRTCYIFVIGLHTGMFVCPFSPFVHLRLPVQMHHHQPMVIIRVLPPLHIHFVQGAARGFGLNYNLVVVHNIG